MIRLSLSLIVAALVGAVALRIAFGIFGGLLGLLLTLAWIALKLFCVGGAVYFALTIVSPESARRIRVALGFEGTPTHSA